MFDVMVAKVKESGRRQAAGQCHPGNAWVDSPRGDSPAAASMRLPSRLAGLPYIVIKLLEPLKIFFFSFNFLLRPYRISS